RSCGRTAPTPLPAARAPGSGPMAGSAPRPRGSSRRAALGQIEQVPRPLIPFHVLGRDRTADEVGKRILPAGASAAAGPAGGGRPMAVEIIFETHSISTDNEAGIATGWLPGRLSARGRELARALGERRRADRPDVVFVSDLARAVETAELAFAGSGIPIRQDPRLRECNYGELNGMPTARLAAERRRRIDEPFPGGQSYREVVAAMRAFLRGGRTLEELVDAPFAWQEGWHYTLPTGWTGAPTSAPVAGPQSGAR